MDDVPPINNLCCIPASRPLVKHVSTHARGSLTCARSSTATTTQAARPSRSPGPTTHGTAGATSTSGSAAAFPPRKFSSAQQRGRDNRPRCACTFCICPIFSYLSLVSVAAGRRCCVRRAHVPSACSSTSASSLPCTAVAVTPRSMPWSASQKVLRTQNFARCSSTDTLVFVSVGRPAHACALSQTTALSSALHCPMESTAQSDTL
jgi:hypothetical protein